MTNEEAYNIISKFCFTGFENNKKPSFKLFGAIHELILDVEENTKLKAEIEQLKAELEQFKNIHKSSIVEIGMEVFVITQYGTHEKEIIKCKVNRKTLKSKITFSANGLYKNFNYYNGTFTDSSIGKKVFLSREEAEQSLKAAQP